MAAHGCELCIEERLRTVKRDGGEAVVRQRLLVQRKRDAFDRADYERVTAFSASQAARFEELNRNVTFREGVPFNWLKRNTVKQKLLYNKEKAMLRQINNELGIKETTDTLSKLAAASTRTRVKIPDLVYFERELPAQKAALFELISGSYARAVERWAETIKWEEMSTQTTRNRPTPETLFRLNDQGALNDYIIVFFSDPRIAQSFCDDLRGKIFNKSLLKPEILPNK